MDLCKEIMQMIEDKSRIAAPTGKGSNLYSDFAFDSLSFVTLLLGIEDAFSITFDIPEMEQCVQVERLIALTGLKIEERGRDDTKLDPQADE